MIRRAELSDIPRIAEIHVFGWRSSYKRIVSDEILFNKMQVSKKIPIFEKVLNENAAENYVFDDGIIKAFMTIGACRDDDKSGAYELWGIYVEPHMKRDGIGTTMAEHCEKRAIKQGYSEICLWVLEENHSARNFYEKLGYSTDGTSKYLESLALLKLDILRYYNMDNIGKNAKKDCGSNPQ